MIDEESGGCYDALEENGPFYGQGAEGLLSWYTSVLAMDARQRRPLSRAAYGSSKG